MLEAAAAAGRKPEASIWKAFQTAVACMKRDAQSGEVIPKSDIPRFFTQTYGVINLYCIDLAGFRRCFYTLEGRDVIFLDLVDHAQYNKWFKVRKK